MRSDGEKTARSIGMVRHVEDGTVLFQFVVE